MLSKKFKSCFLSLFGFICAICCCATIAATGNRNLSVSAAEGVKEYTVGTVSFHTLSNNGKIYVLFYDGEGNECDLGYTQWVLPDAYTTKFEEYLTINDKKMSEVDNVTIQGMDIKNALCISGFYLSEGGTITIPKDAVFENASAKLTFTRNYTITWDGEKYTVEAEHQEVVFPDYVMEEGMLSDFTDKSVKRLGGQDYHDAVPDKAGWDTNYHSFFRSGFVSADDAPEGSTNGGYKFEWDWSHNRLISGVCQQSKGALHENVWSHFQTSN